MKTTAKLLFSSIAAAFVLAGTLIILNRTYTASTRRAGIVTTEGDQAVWLGQTFILLGLLPLVVWLPRRWLGVSLALWWLALMAWVFFPLLFP